MPPEERVSEVCRQPQGRASSRSVLGWEKVFSVQDRMQCFPGSASHHQTPFCVGRGRSTFWFCCSPDSRALWVAGIQGSKGSGCFLSTHGENSLFCRSLPPVPCYLNPLNPHASAGHLTSESSGLLRCPSIKTPILHQRKPLGSPHSQHSGCCLVAFPGTIFSQDPLSPCQEGFLE